MVSLDAFQESRTQRLNVDHGLELLHPAAANHPIHGLMSRTGSFPLPVAYKLLATHCPPGARVLDPFCGKGTTLLAGRLLGCAVYGVDVSPEAVICSKAKLVGVSLDEVCKYVDSLDPGRRRSSKVPRRLDAFFHPFTYGQILHIREQLLKDVHSLDETTREASTLTLAALLGILHGHASYSLSVASSHAFAMSPSYVHKYCTQHGLERPRRDVKECLKAKLAKCLAVTLPRAVASEVVVGQAESLTTHYVDLVGKVDVVLTSPPYLNSQTYAKDNWLRLWLLGIDYRNILKEFLQTGSTSKYARQMTVALKQISAMLKPGGKLICVAGDVRVRRGQSGCEIFQTGNVLAQLCHEHIRSLKVETTEVHLVESNQRYLHSLSSSNGHSKSRLTERVFVAVKEIE